MQPSVSLPEDQAEIERVLSGQADLSYSMTFEVLPAIELADFKSLKLERLVADVDAEAIDKAVGELVERSVTFTPEEGRAARDRRSRHRRLRRQDRRRSVRRRHRPRARRSCSARATSSPASRTASPGAKAGEERDVVATFPADYPVATLAGKAANFAVKVKEVAASVRPEVNDEFAKTLGAESVAQLKELVGAQIEPRVRPTPRA